MPADIYKYQGEHEKQNTQNPKPQNPKTLNPNPQSILITLISGP